MRPQVACCLAVAAGSVVAQKTEADTLSPVSHVKGKAFDRLAVIWLENTDYEMAIGDPNLAWLASKGVSLSNYFGVTHPSEPNYIASHGGDYFGMNNDAVSTVDANVSSVVDLLEEKGIAWGEYQEDMPYTGFQGKEYVNQVTGANAYVRKHNPAVIYGANAEKADRLGVMKNLTLFYDDLAKETLPQWMFITPNMTSDGHDTSVTVAGKWTRGFLEPLLNDTRFMNNTAVLVTFDENSSYALTNRVAAILIGDAIPAELVGSTDSSFYNHYSEIATVSANWDLHTLGRWDTGANVFSWVAEKTGDVVREWNDTSAPPLGSMFFNQSYDGVFNNKGSFPVYPSPNVDIESPSGRTVLPAVKEKWAGSSNPDYYTSVLEVPDGLHPPDRYDV